MSEKEAIENAMEAAREVDAEMGISPVIRSVDIRVQEPPREKRMSEQPPARDDVDTSRLDRLFDEHDEKVTALEERMRLNHMQTRTDEQIDKELEEMGW